LRHENPTGLLSTLGRAKRRADIEGEKMRSVAVAIAFCVLAACGAPGGSRPSEDLAARVQTLEDEREIRRVADDLDTAVDRKDWASARALFTDEVEADFTSLGAATPGKASADTLIENWRRNLHTNKTSARSRTNETIRVNGDTASMTSQGHVRYELPQRTSMSVWEGWGQFEHKFTRTPQGWRISGLKFNLTREQGEASVRNEMAPPDEE
jgi:ketosteroid isomerase-like protein